MVQIAKACASSIEAIGKFGSNLLVFMLTFQESIAVEKVSTLEQVQNFVYAMRNKEAPNLPLTSSFWS
jgi:hypothetical protein